MRSVVPLMFELSKPGRRGYDLPQLDVPAAEALIPAAYLSQTAPRLPELSEVTVVRHFTGLSAGTSAWTAGSTPWAPAP